ncbi:hypothetical protein C8J55DRAFT_564777 [Lentinula edodes]|uniref:Pali-domain-containing protein n=1 Tax=Lentinula lateritia TaxID=40482 RepID=A0A9W8ZWE2_9AGAR|nr:hypothetical protein C8J55DRAFT_564777 [Lentinula edodes]
MSLFLLRPAVFLLATVYACPSPAHAEVASHSGMVFGPDSNGVCYEGSFQGSATPCPTQIYPHLPKTAVAAIVIAVVFGVSTPSETVFLGLNADAVTCVNLFLVIALCVVLLLWRRQVRATTDDSASSLFDFVSGGRRLSTSNSSLSPTRPNSPRLSVKTMIGSQSILNEKELHESESYFHHGSHGPEADVEGSVETLTAPRYGGLLYFLASP